MNVKAADINEQSSWREMTPGGEIYEPCTAAAVNTGDWRTKTPVWDESKCRQCLLCAPWCPDSAIPVRETAAFSGDDASIADGDFSTLKPVRGDFDFKHCKGCGICGAVCPFGAITFVEGGGK